MRRNNVKPDQSTVYRQISVDVFTTYFRGSIIIKFLVIMIITSAVTISQCLVFVIQSKMFGSLQCHHCAGADGTLLSNLENSLG